ncbi:MAG: hypothetical protein EGP81_01500 [Bacteroides clarus]|nr:hypothetical protein [Bacteroides clarus]
MRKYYILYINNNIIRKKKKELPPLPLFSFRETRDRKRATCRSRARTLRSPAAHAGKRKPRTHDR